MMTFDEPTENGKDWSKQKTKRAQLSPKDTLKANKPVSVFETDNKKASKNNDK